MGWKNDTINSYFSSSFHFHPFSRHSLGRDVVSWAAGNGIAACKKTNRARPDLTQTHRYTLINNKLTPRRKFSSVDSDWFRTP